MASHDAELSRGGPIMLSAGEASGDLHGGALCGALRRLAPTVRLVGMGGPRMAAAGMDVVVDVTARAVVGGSEAIGRLPGLYRAFRVLRARLGEERPRALVLIDFPEFNMQLARRARRAGVPVVYFIPPQLWAWRRGRIRQMARWVTRVLAVLPFERALYEAARVPVSFVGHPLLDVLPSGGSRAGARAALGVPEGERVLGLLPGSRREEVARLLPPMLEAARALERAGAIDRALLAVAPTIERDGIDRMVAASGGGAGLAVVEARTYEVLAAADAALVCSGTATLEAALLGTPMVVCYRVSLVTAALARLLIRTRWASLPNNILGRGAVPELLQFRATGARLAAEAGRLLADRAAADGQRRAFAEIRSLLGDPGVADRAARAVLDTAGMPA